MRKALFALLVAVALLLGSPAHAQAAPQWQIGITEVTGAGSWPELAAVVEALRTTYGVPINAEGCTPGQPCIHVWHYIGRDGRAGMAAPRPGEPRSSNVGLNHAYDRGSAYRQMVLFHEFGHALGLREHDDTCRSSMAPAIYSCGRYVLGYTPEQHATLKQIWG